MVTAPNSIAFLFLCCTLGFSILFLLIIVATSIRIVPENARIAVAKSNLCCERFYLKAALDGTMAGTVRASGQDWKRQERLPYDSRNHR